jgi:hypothetical protein
VLQPKLLNSTTAPSNARQLTRMIRMKIRF